MTNKLVRVIPQYSLEYLKFPRFVSKVLNPNHKSTGIESKNVLGISIRFVPLNTILPIFIALALIRSDFYQQFIALLKFADGIQVICTYLLSVCVKSQ